MAKPGIGADGRRGGYIALARDRRRRLAGDRRDQGQESALAAAAAAKQASGRAEGNFVLARESVEKYLGTVTEDPDLMKSDFHKLRKKLLESAVPFLRRIAEQNSDDPTVQDRRGRAFHRLAIVHYTLGEYETAIRDCEAMTSCFTGLVNDSPAVPYYREELAASYFQLGRSLEKLGKRAEAETAYHRALDLLERLVADSPIAAYRQNLSELHNSRGLWQPAWANGLRQKRLTAAPWNWPSSL
ncbi:MAG: tetratricopeptide repeat protein [Isosphaeraceae bacterium]